MQSSHIHTHDSHNWGIRFSHLMHDPRFWAAVALIILLGLMILAVMTGGTPTGHGHMNPAYPMYPYMP